MSAARALCSGFSVVIGLVVLSTPALAGANPRVTLPLHAKLGEPWQCREFQPVDCVQIRPVVNVPADTVVVIYLLMYNHVEVHGVQTAYEWDPSWILLDCWMNCQGQFEGWPPCGGLGEPGGPVHGAITTAFRCLSGPVLEPFGRLLFATGPGGCFRQVEPALPNGLMVVHCRLSTRPHRPGGPRAAATPRQDLCWGRRP